MNKRRVFPVLVCLILFVQCLSMAQTAASVGPHKVLWIFREDVKVARGAVHQQVEHGYAQLWAKGQVQPFLALEAQSGNATEVLFISGYDSFAALEKDNQAYGKASGGPMKGEYDALAKQEAELVNAVRSSVVIYRPDLSYRADRVMPVLPKARYMEITIARTRMDKAEAFAAGAKLYRDAYEKLNIDMPWVLYEASEGLPNGTYLLLTPMKSLKEMDDMLAMEPKIMAAMGEEALKNLAKATTDLFVSVESNLYEINPKMSYVPKEFAAGDPEFWAPKAKVTPAPAAGAKKPAQ